MKNKILLNLVVLASLVWLSACNRNTMPYGGVKEGAGAQKYNEELNINQPPAIALK